MVSSYGVLQTQYSLVSFLLSRELVVEIIFFFLALEPGPADMEEGGPPGPPPAAASLSSSRLRLCAEAGELRWGAGCGRAWGAWWAWAAAWAAWWAAA